MLRRLLLTGNSAAAFHPCCGRASSHALHRPVHLNWRRQPVFRAVASSQERKLKPDATHRKVPSLSSPLAHGSTGKMLRADGAGQVALGDLLGRGNYGEVYVATLLNGLDGTSQEVVAKCAKAKNPEHTALSRRWLESEAAINADISGLPGICGYLGEATSDEGERYLLFERVRPLDGADGPPNSCAYLLKLESDPWPITPRQVLRNLLSILSKIHAAGYLHHDVKLENILLQISPAGTVSLKLIDFGAAVSLEGCDLFGRLLKRCALDEDGAVNTKVYRPPERFPDIEHPFAYDIFAAAICFLRLAWAGAVDSGPALSLFRRQLDAADGDLECWLRSQLNATVVPDTLLNALACFPAGDPVAFAAVRAMLHPDPAKRPSADALLAHPFLADSFDVERIPESNDTMFSPRLDELFLAAR